MNILIDKLPTDYEGLKINTNFRSFILFELLMQDNKLSNQEKITLSLKLFYKDEIFDSKEKIEKAIKGILWFYSLGKKEEKENKKSNVKDKKIKQIYSYEYDANLIYSAFLSQYKIDLNEIKYLHWFKFKSLFNGLNDNNKICEIMSYRAIDINKIKDKEERKKYKKIQRDVALPDNRTLEEKEQDFANSLW